MKTSSALAFLFVVVALVHLPSTLAKDKCHKCDGACGTDALVTATLAEVDADGDMCYVKGPPYVYSSAVDDTTNKYFDCDGKVANVPCKCNPAAASPGKGPGCNKWIDPATEVKDGAMKDCLKCKGATADCKFNVDGFEANPAACKETEVCVIEGSKEAAMAKCVATSDKAECTESSEAPPCKCTEGKCKLPKAGGGGDGTDQGGNKGDGGGDGGVSGLLPLGPFILALVGGVSVVAVKL